MNLKYIIIMLKYDYTYIGRYAFKYTIRYSGSFGYFGIDLALYLFNNG